MQTLKVEHHFQGPFLDRSIFPLIIRGEMPIIHWFRRDLRLIDNTALSAALRDSNGQVLPVFVFDPRLLDGRDVAPARIRFLIDCLRDLDNNLAARSTRLIIRRGDSATELLKLAAEVSANVLYFNRDYTPLGRKRDQRVTCELQRAGCRVASFTDQVIHDPTEVVTQDGKPYTVFTPYKRRWLALPKPQPQTSVPWSIPMVIPAAAPQHIPTPAELGCRESQTVPRGGETIAMRLLDAFIHNGLADYHQQRDMPAVEGTSRLSPHLRFGTISARACYHRVAAIRDADSSRKPSEQVPGAEAREGAVTWINELVWREFYTQVLFHFPHADQSSYKVIYDRIQWGSGDPELDKSRMVAWCEGRTGYPFVDAAMRQLKQTAWMHNRARMVVASFFTHDLLLDWRAGESYFMQQLVDGDPASNNGGWQWAAGTGTDAQPYFRVFNPILQSQRFDPHGLYIKRYVAELVEVPVEYIHSPWKMPIALQQSTGCVIGRNYPAPVVNHAIQRMEIISRFKECRA